MKLLINLFLYITGIVIGLCVVNYGHLFWLMTIPTMIVFYILDQKERRFKLFIEKVKKELENKTT